MLLHHPDQGAVEPEVRRPREDGTAPTRSACSPATTPINGEAPIVVMTTEVLRNMLYAGSSTLTGLGFVVMDEVHYLADRFRGAVWEEVIIHLPESVALVSLSRDGVQRRGVRRVARDGARRDHHDRRGAPAGAALPARDGGPAALRPLRGRRRRRRPGRPGQPRARCGSPATTSAPPGPATAARARNGPRGRAGAARPGSAPAVHACPAGSTWSSGSTPRGCCRRSTSSSAGSAATPRSRSA